MTTRRKTELAGRGSPEHIKDASQVLLPCASQCGWDADRCFGTAYSIKPKKTRKRLRQDAKPSNVKLLAIIFGGFVPPPRALKGQGFPRRSNNYDV